LPPLPPIDKSAVDDAVEARSEVVAERRRLDKASDRAVLVEYGRTPPFTFGQSPAAFARGVLLYHSVIYQAAYEVEWARAEKARREQWHRDLTPAQKVQLAAIKFADDEKRRNSGRRF
jgi:hypothetical protein